MTLGKLSKSRSLSRSETSIGVAWRYVVRADSRPRPPPRRSSQKTVLRSLDSSRNSSCARTSVVLRRRTTDVRAQLEFLLESNDRNTVFWLERRGGGRGRESARTTYLQATPIDVSDLLSDLLFESFPSVILTSATLTVQGGFVHIRKRLGMRDASE